MSRRLTAEEQNDPRNPLKSIVRYPWNRWLDGDQHKLVHGEDFPTIDIESFRRLMYRQAAKRNLSIRSKYTDEGLLYLQAVPYKSR